MSLGAGLCFGLTACAGGRAEGDGAAPRLAAGEPAATCLSWELAGRSPLVLPDGTEAYVEPQNVLRLEGRGLVVGSPTYVWDTRSGDRASIVAEREHIAGDLDAASPELVSLPIEGTAGSVRALALPGGRLGVLIPEIDPDSLPAKEDVRALWYAEWDGSTWSDAEALPLPPAGRLFPATSSNLVVTPNGLAWAALLAPGLLLYERGSGGWRITDVLDLFVEAVALATDSDGTLWAVMTGEDPELREFTKTVRLMRRDGNGWRLETRLLDVGPYADAGWLRVAAAPNGFGVSWGVAGPDGPRAYGATGLPGAPVTFRLDPASTYTATVHLGGSDFGWIVEHVDDATRTNTLRFLIPSGGEAVEVASVASPYSGYFAALGAPSDVHVVGPDFDPDPAHATVRSLTLRFRPSCA